MYDMYDYHLHSTHSGDGKVPDIVQAMAAIERGVKEICISTWIFPMHQRWISRWIFLPITMIYSLYENSFPINSR